MPHPAPHASPSPQRWSAATASAALLIAAPALALMLAGCARSALPEAGAPMQVDGTVTAPAARTSQAGVAEASGSGPGIRDADRGPKRLVEVLARDEAAARAPGEAPGTESATGRAGGAGVEEPDGMGSGVRDAGADAGLSGGHRLADAASPYLRLHADDPVAWYPWGQEAFAAARERDVPIFLSIGYSACHWCHVMERESFEDPQVAALMNEAFVNVKVDREERPGIDQVYMTTCQALGGRCGWPLNVLITADGEPFFATTYVPKEQRFGRRGMLELVPQIQEVWRGQREEVVAQAADIARTLRAAGTGGAGEAAGPDAATLARAVEELTFRYDAVHGGFGDAPKFPAPHQLLLLTRHAEREDDAATMAMVTNTLRAMRRGGIFDQVGLGFHRYATDASWTVPHFEKMLYDQAMLAFAYTEAYQATGEQDLARVTREIFTYVLRDLRAPQGAFFSAEDADSEGREGAFYVWTEDQLRAALGTDAAWAMEALGASQAGNLPAEDTGLPAGENVLRLPRAQMGAADVAPGEPRLEAVRRRLLAARAPRERPLLDDKILADWNGLMIAALARGGVVLEEPRYVREAAVAADFVLRELQSTEGRLLHRWHDGVAGVPGTLDDHAFLTSGLLELYGATFDVRWLQEALRLTDDTLAHFDDGGGGLYLTADDAERLIVRPRTAYDGALPSGSSVAMLNLLRLARLTGNTTLEERAAELARAFGEDIARAPSGFAQMMVAVDFAIGPSWEVVLAGDPAAADTRAMVAALRTAYVPRKVVHLRPHGEAEPPIDRLASYTAYMVAEDGRATAYVCQDFVCNQPTTDPETMLAMLRGEIGVGAQGVQRVQGAEGAEGAGERSSESGEESP